MADVNAETVPAAGLAPTPNPASAGGDTVPVGTLVRFQNEDVSPHTVTLITPGVVQGDLAVEDRDVPVAASGAAYVQVSRQPYGDSDGRASITYDDVTGMSFEVLKL